ncbi:hypothetical protein ACFSTD_01885 [Novosphingobium colocasiae]
MLKKANQIRTSASIIFMVPVGVDPTQGGQPKSGFRDVQLVIDELERWRDAGGTSASISTAGMGFTSVDQHF